MNTTSRESDSKKDERIDKLADQLSTLVEIVSKKVVTPALIKAVEEIGKVLELAKIQLNENCSAMLLKKLPEKLGDPGKFLIPYVAIHFLEEFADELALLDPFPPGNEDVDVEAELREIELLLNRDPSINFSPRITFDPNPESNDESSHEEVTHEMSFITYSNPLFDLDEEIISSDFNPIHNKVLDSIPKNDHFDAKSYLPESPLNHDTLTFFSPRNDPLHHEFAGEIITPPLM
ncbi:hypothetical protein Tco_0676814 [Tanacetum coccineum]